MKNILSPFNGRKNQKAWKKTREKYTRKKRKNLAETDRGSYYNQEEWLKEFLDNKGLFYNGIEAATGATIL